MLDNIKPILSSVEKVSIYASGIKCFLYGDILQLFTNLKHLYVDDVNRSHGNKWLLHQYPALEHFILNSYSIDLPELRTLFELNPKIRRFSTVADLIIYNENWMKESNIHLDELNINCYEPDDMSDICRLMNILFERGFYKRLNLDWLDYFDQEIFNSIASLNGLDKLYFNDDCMGDFVKTAMPQLKEFCMEDASSIDDILDILVDSFMNIKRIYFEWANFISILPFIHHSAKLKKIKIQTPEDDGTYCNGGIIDLLALNRERKKCADASKITFYVGEEFYLQTKEALMTTNFNLIGLKRAESLVWDLLTI